MVRHVIVVALVCCLAACGGDAPASPTGHDWIEIVSVTPARGTTLTAGDQVTFTVNLSCTVASKDAGTTLLLIADQGRRTLNNPAGAQARASLGKGTATVTLSDVITAPASGSTINVIAALLVEGSNVTGAYQQASFPVK